MVGAAGPSITAYGNRWPNATWVPGWVTPSTGNFVSNAFATGPGNNAYFDNLALNLQDSTGIGDNMTSPAINLIGRTGNRAVNTIFGLQAVPNGGTNTSANSTLVLTQRGFTTGWFANSLRSSGATFSPISAPVASVSTRGTAGSTTYTYVVVAKGGTGSVANSPFSTTTGNATLNSTNYNHLVVFATAGGWGFDIYRTVGGATAGKIGSITLPLTAGNSVSQPDNLIFDDTGLTGDGSTAPVTNTTGQILSTSGSLTFGSDVVAPNLTVGNLTINGACSGSGCGGAGGSGTVQSIATTAPITGGPFSVTGTIDCPTCLVASSPVVGVLHAAGSTQTLTSSPVVDADLSGQVAIAHGGTNAATAAAARINLLPAGTKKGDILYCATYAAGACTLWDLLAGNGTGSTGWLQEVTDGTPSWSIPPGSGTVVVAGSGNLTDTALVTGNGTQVVQTPSATSTLDASGNLSLAAGGSIGSKDTGTPKFTFGTNLITANKQITGTIFSGTGFQISGAAANRTLLIGNGTSFVGGTLQAADIPSLSATYLSMSGGSLGGNLTFDVDNLRNIGNSTTNRPANVYATTLVEANTINARTGLQIGGAAPAGHFLAGTGSNYADNPRLIDNGSTLSYPGEIQAGSISITTPFQIYSTVPASPFSAVAGNSGIGFSDDGNFYVSNNGGTPSQVLTAAANTFDKVLAGTNTSAAMLVGTGGKSRANRQRHRES